MPSQLESALVLRLRSPIKWAAALDAPASGTLTPVDPSKPFSPLDYAQRDRELMFRDVIVGAAILDTSIEVSDVWEHETDRPQLQGPVLSTLPLDRGSVTSTGTNLSMVRHVHNASIPLDAARYADADLYGRDALVYEVIARACQTAFSHPPILPMDSTGTLISLSGTTAWSLAEGVEQQADINSALTLQRDAFKRADQFLADRDNQLAAYAARLAQVLKNPFAYAMRLYVRVDGPGPHEPETYVLVTSDGTNRVWQAEPALDGRFRIVYNIAHSTLQWFREQTDELHVPQLYAMTIPGIEPNQVLTTIPEIPDPQDCQYWRRKAGQVVPDGISISDTESFMDWTSGSDSVGGILQSDSASLTVPGVIEFVLPGTVTGKPRNTAFTQYYRVAALAQPNSLVEVTGGENISETGGTDGGATWELAVSTVGAKDYFVVGGDGIVYDSTTYFPGQSFKGKTSLPTFTQVNAAFPSTVRQQVCNWSMALPPGAWSLQLEYTNLSGSTTGFGVAVTYTAGANVVDVIQDVTPLPFSGDNGTLLKTTPSFFDVSTVDPAVVGVSWNYGDGEFHVRKLIFDSSQIATGSYAVQCQLGDGTASANVTGINKLTEAMLWEVPVTGTHTADVSLRWTDAPSCPVRFKQVQVQTVGSYAATPNSFGFGGWRLECLDRAERVIQHGYSLTVAAYGTNLATVCPDNVISAGTWTQTQQELWMGLVEVKNPRLREMADIDADGISLGRQYEVTSGIVIYDSGTFQTGDRFYGTGGTTYSGGAVKQVGALIKSKPGHVGRPCLVPQGVYVGTDGSVNMANDTAQATPVFASCQPWMIDIGAYVVQEDFWMPDFYDQWDTARSGEAQRVLIGVQASPSGGGTVLGGGFLRVNSLTTISATLNITDPNNTWSFVNWTDSNLNVVSTSLNYTFLVTEPQTFTANFSASPVYYPVTLNLNPVAGGTITGGTTAFYPYGTVLDLMAVPTMGVFAADVGADIVIVLDESGSMGTERSWVKTLAVDLDAFLKSNNIGSATVPNRFGLVGFGGDKTKGYEVAHKHLISGLEFASTDNPSWSTNFNAAVDSIGSHYSASSAVEDGYAALTMALGSYGWRVSFVGKVIVLLTDEPRNTVARTGSSDGDPDPAYLASLKASFVSGNYITAGMLGIKLYATGKTTDPPSFHGLQFGPIMGFGWNGISVNGVAYAFNGSAFTGTNTGGYSGNIDTPNVANPAGSMFRTTYENLFIDSSVKGSEWDLYYLRAGIYDPAYTVSLTSAFVSHIEGRIEQNLSWQFVNWTGSITSTDNPLSVTVNGTFSVTANFNLA